MNERNNIKPRDPRELLENPAAAPAKAVAMKLMAEGYEVFFAGGCVRDTLLGRQPKDFDLASSATHDVVRKLFPHTLDVGKAFGVMVVVMEGAQVEVATFRTDGPYIDGRRPASVEFSTAREDAARRDFTINGMFINPQGGELVDYVEGLRDLRRGVVAAIGDPAARFNDDRLRMLRATRFASTLGFSLEDATLNAIRGMAATINEVSAERIGVEVTRTLTESKRAGEALRLLDATGLLRHVMPEVHAMRGVEQPPQFHPEGDVFTHTALMLDSLPAPPRDLRLTLAALLHDVGKPPTFTIERTPDRGEIIRFMGHAAVGATIAEIILRRLKQPAAIVEDVADMVRRHMSIAEVKNMRESTLRRYMGAATFPLELQLARLDAIHSNGDLSHYEFAAARYAEFRHKPVLPEPWLMGRDLLEIGFEPGPAMGELLKRAYDMQLEGGVADRAGLLEWARLQAK